MPEYGEETSSFARLGKVQNASNRRKVLFLQFVGTRKGCYWNIIDRGSAVNSARYSGMQCDELKTAIWSKWTGLLSEGFVLLHDNARPYTAAHTVETLKELNFEVLEHLQIVLTLSLRTITCLAHLNKP